uniref:Uncharacterized protein n=1 Tax=Romanomermis culicivorax TaxID=13658 RepID=A0A915J2N8_ROMCU
MQLEEHMTSTYKMPKNRQTPAKKVLSAINTCKRFLEVNFEKFGEELLAWASFPYVGLRNLDKHGLVALAAQWHALLFRNMSDTYHTILRNSQLPPVSYRNGVMSVCLPEKGTSNRYVIYNIPRKRTAGYHLLLAHRRNDLVINQLIYPDRNPVLKPTKLTLQNILHDIKEDLSIRKDVSFITEYLEVMGQFLKMQGIRTKEHLEAF